MNTLTPRPGRVRRLWRHGLLASGAGLIAGGYVLLAVPAGTALAQALDRAFAGMALVAAGALVAIASRLWR